MSPKNQNFYLLSCLHFTLKMITQTQTICKYCNVPNCIITDFSSGSIVCTNCGVVHEDRIIDEEYESRGFVDENGKSTSRIGSAVNFSYYDDISNSITVVSKKNKRLKNPKNFSNNPIANIFNQAEEIALKLNIPKMIFESSKNILYSLVKENKIKGKNKEYVIAIVFFKVLFMNKIHRSLKDIASRLNLEMNEMKKTYSSIADYLIDNEKKDQNFSLVQFEGNVRLILSKLEVSKESKKAIDEIGESIVKSEIFSGKNPGTIASVVIFLVGNMLKDKSISLKQISEYSGIKERTIKQTYTSLMNYTKVIPEKYKGYIKNLRWDEYSE